MKKIYLHKQSHCLFYFIIAVLLCLSGVPPLVAATTTSFPFTDFWVVDHTTLEYAPLSVNPKGIIGYKPNPDNNNPNEYQLTDTIPNMTVAIWNKNKIDMNQDWEFNFALFFGTGNFTYTDNENKPIGSRDIADGFCFVLHNNAVQNLIGGTALSIGYGGISPSFAVEFDTEWNGTNESIDPVIGSRHHISYIKDGNLRALPNTCNPMQNYWANVGVGDWFDVKIVWRKGYKANNTTYYDLLTYMEEKSYTTSPLLLRDSMRFNSFSEVVAGLELDENCQALVTWGVTSATCGAANQHRIRFLKLTAETGANELSIGLHRTIAPHVPQVQADQLFLYNPAGSEQIFAGKSSCGLLYSLPDTIRSSKIRCLSQDPNFPQSLDYFLTFKGTGANMMSARWYVNDSLVKIGTEWDSTKRHYLFNISEYEDLYKDSIYVVIKAVVNETDYVFKFAVNENPALAVQLAQALNIQLDTANSNTLNLNVNSTSLAQTIQLPEIGGCSDGQRWRQYTWQPQPDSLSPFAVLPQIDSNNVLTFELKPDVCSANIDIELLCECNTQFTLAVNNTTCPPSCDVVTFTETRRTYNPSGGMYQMLSFMTPLFIGYSVLATPPHEITTISAKEIGISYPEVNLVLEDVYNDINSDGEPCKSLYVTLNGRVSDTIYKRYEVCAKLEDGTICCDTFEFYGYFNGKGMVDIMPYGGYVEIAYCDVTSFVETPIGGATGPYIRLTIHDFFGNQVDDLTNEVIATPTGGNIYYDISHLIPGQYTVVFQVNDQIKSKIFLKMAGQ